MAHIGTGLSDQLVYALEGLNLQHTFLSCVPSSIGSSDAIDSATRAVTTAFEFQRSGNEKLAPISKAHYTKAIGLVRESIGTSDSSLAAVGLLNVYESLMRATTGAQNLAAYFAHNQGMGAILLARPNDPDQISDMSRAVLYLLWDRTFRVPCRLGVPSPFENTIWEDVEPVDGRGNTPLRPEVRSLRLLTNKLFIRLPRLVMQVRTLREQSATSSPITDDQAEPTLRLAREILNMKNMDAETKFLHNVSVVKTETEGDRNIAPYSFAFRSVYDMETGVLYWETRLIILRLCMVLEQLRIGGMTRFAEALLDAEQARMASNIIMSWQYGTGYGAAGVHSMMNAMAIVWGSLPSVCQARKIPLDVARSWTLSHFHASLAGWPIKMSAADMDQTSGVFAGGPLDQGFLKAIYAAGRYRC